jgi:hypothetical protein
MNEEPTLSYPQQIDVDPDINPDDYANQPTVSDDEDEDDPGYIDDPDDVDGD